VREIERALDNQLYYLAIIVCLMMPDVCAALEAENGRSSENLYKAWYLKHAKAQAGGVEPDECYSLRCGGAHQGRMEIKKGFAQRAIFTIRSSKYKVDGITMKSGDQSAYVFDAERWCRRWIAAVRVWQETVKDNPTVKRNSQNMLQLRPDGLAPFMVGQPIIA